MHTVSGVSGGLLSHMASRNFECNGYWLWAMVVRNFHKGAIQLYPEVIVKNTYEKVVADKCQKKINEQLALLGAGPGIEKIILEYFRGDEVKLSSWGSRRIGHAVLCKNSGSLITRLMTFK
ncbi:MAG: hypothetical protein HRU15_01890 [Planctomycetes bacterium]|nr:hypothetical protein [Planctomycetota bacterium]